MNEHKSSIKPVFIKFLEPVISTLLVLEISSLIVYNFSLMNGSEAIINLITTLIFFLISYFGVKWVLKLINFFLTKLQKKKEQLAIFMKSILAGFFWGFGLMLGTYFLVLTIAGFFDDSTEIANSLLTSIIGISMSLGSSHSWN